jgi:hypothetical protein
VGVVAREPVWEEQPPEQEPLRVCRGPEPALRRALKMWLVGLQEAALQLARSRAPQQVVMLLVPGQSTSCILRTATLPRVMWLPEKAYCGS